MTLRNLGNSGIAVPPLCLGTNVFGWTADEPTAFRLLDAAVASDLNFLDTADVYSRWAPGNHGGESETMIGNWLKRTGNRKSVIIATKVGMEMGPGKKGLSKAYILSAAEESLRRLQTDYIDLYQSHEDDPNTSLQETLEAHAQLIKEGKVRAIGASNYSAERLAEALRVSQEHGLPRYQTLQPFYNLYDRARYEESIESLCLNEDLGVISYFSLARGFLSGKYRSESDLSKSQRGGGVKDYLNGRGFRILAALDQVAKIRNATQAQVALAWLMARPSITAPIASATSLEQLRDLIAATQLELDEASIEFLNDASDWKKEKAA
jgi:aryl-alcohol dehydrogenase-like predicted oxidoreductase